MNNGEYNARRDPQYDRWNPEPEEKESATEKFMNNAGRQPGMGGRRRFVPPSKNGDGYGPGSGGQCGSFNPGQSVK